MTDHSRYKDAGFASCSAMEELCLLRDTGELSAQDLRALEDHLSGCADCRGFAEATRAASRSAQAASREPPASVEEAVRSLLREEPVGSPWNLAASLGTPRVPVWFRPAAALGLAAASIFSLVYWDASRVDPVPSGARGMGRPAVQITATAASWANGLETELAQAETEVNRLDSALLAEYFEEDIREDFRELERSKKYLERDLESL